MTYKEELTAAMDLLAEEPKRIFVGYGLRPGGDALGTLKHIPDRQILNMPTAENLMLGAAIGLSLAGYKPVVFFERFDFVLNAADAIVNHLDKIADESKGEFTPAVIMRVVVGNSRKPLFTGSTHTQDFTDAFEGIVKFPVTRLSSPNSISGAYKRAAASLHSSMIVEFKDLH